MGDISALQETKTEVKQASSKIRNQYPMGIGKKCAFLAPNRGGFQHGSLMKIRRKEASVVIGAVFRNQTAGEILW